MNEHEEELYRALRGVLEDNGLFVSDDVDERLVGLVQVVLDDPRNKE